MGVSTVAAFSVLLAQDRYTVDESIFLNPSNEYRLIQYELSDTTLKKYPEYGIGGFLGFFYKNLYQSGIDGPAQIGPLVDAAHAKGMEVWLADDFGYPSGMAGGRIVAENPDWRVNGLAMATLYGSGVEPQSYKLPEWGKRFASAEIYPVVDGVRQLDRGKAVPVGSDPQITFDGLEGDWELCAFILVVRDGQAKSTAKQFKHTGEYPDLLNPEVTQRFLANMHEPIVARIDDLPAKVKGFYSNEPNLMQMHWKLEDVPYACLPWNAALPATFRQMHGYDLLPVLAALYEGNGLEARRIRIHYHQTVAKMFAENFARQIRQWCHEHGILSSGHFLLEEYLSMHVGNYGDMMLFTSEFDVPALDTGIPNPRDFATFDYRPTRLYSSIGAWKGQTDVIILLDPIVSGGGHKRLSPALPLLLNSTNMAFLHGANIISSYMPLDPMDNARMKATGYDPAVYRAYNEYVGRIASVLRGAQHDARVALYYPIAMFQADYIPQGRHWTKILPEHEQRQNAWNQVQDVLLDARIEFNIVHPQGVEEAKIANGLMTIGSCSYQYLVMPQMEYVPLPVLAKILDFEAAGGTVLWVDSVPTAGAYPDEDATVESTLKNVTSIRPVDLKNEIHENNDAPFNLTFSPAGSDKLALARFRRADTAIYYLVNRTGQELSVRVTSRSGGSVQVLNPDNGQIRKERLPARLRLGAYRSVLVIP